jgi:hypothetical protein
VQHLVDALRPPQRRLKKGHPNRTLSAQIKVSHVPILIISAVTACLLHFFPRCSVLSGNCQERQLRDRGAPYMVPTVVTSYPDVLVLCLMHDTSPDTPTVMTCHAIIFQSILVVGKTFSGKTTVTCSARPLCMPPCHPQAGCPT